ncbi:MAG: hypothetical protein ACFHX7_25460 [Pseudomonadota bacterium]
MDEITLHRLGLAGRLARESQHELNNIMAAAFGYTNLMVARGGEADIGEHLRGTLIRTRNLMERFFLLLREVPDETRPVMVRKLMQDIAELLKVFASHHLIVVESPALEGEVEVHRQKMLQSLLEITLAIREACQGDVSATVRRYAGNIEISLTSVGGSIDPAKPALQLAIALLESMGASVELVGPAQVQVALPEHQAVDPGNLPVTQGPVFLTSS